MYNVIKYWYQINGNAGHCTKSWINMLYYTCDTFFVWVKQHASCTIFFALFWLALVR